MNWYNSDIESVKKELGASDFGLTQKDVDLRMLSYGENKLEEKRKKTFFERFLAQLKDYMVIILIVAAIISVIVTVVEKSNDWTEPIIIIAIVILNAVLGVIQESKAEAALDALKNMSSPNTRVLRDGKVETVKSSSLVPGDIILLEAGEFVPADARLLESASLRCEESALTGESLPVEKSAEATVAEDAPLGDRINMVYSGCSVSYGRATAIVTATGMKTEMGKIAAMLSNQSDDTTPLQEKLAQLGKILGLVALAICFIIFVVGLISNIGLLEIFMTAISLAVAAVPEGLPAIVTIVLAMGVQRMVKNNSIIRRLPAVETLGSASVVCSDKTGTLTQNKMTLVKVWTDGKLLDTSESWPIEAELLITYATLCSDATVTVAEDGTRSEIGDPTETAIVGAALDKEIDKAVLLERYPRVYEIPFDSDRKLMTAVHRIKDRNIAIVKGAPDVLVSRCKNADTESIMSSNDAMAKNALRVLAVGYRVLDEDFSSMSDDEIESGLTVMGLVGMIDPPRPEALKAIKQCKSAGIRPVMITGDHIVTATAIAKQLGILNDESEALTGAQLAEIPDDEFDKTVQNYSVYARVTPHDKLRIVNAWQKKGDVVAMTGDGVNDAPALKTADIGCAMGITGTDVAKGAADMVLTDDNFATIVVAVKEGRGIYDNIKKSIHFLLSCNLGEVLCVFLSMLIFGRSPLLAIHLLLVNLVTDSLPALALGVEPVEKDIMRRKPRKKDENIFAGGLGINVAWQGALIGVLTLIAYIIGDPISHEVGSTMAFATLALSQMFQAMSIRSNRPLHTIGILSNRKLIGAIGISLSIILIALLVPPIASIFSLVTLSWAQWRWIILLSVMPLIIGEAVKIIVPQMKKMLDK